ncbi:diguanylate cyclase [Vibrio maerlii]|uniref:sensor domain-containing diguanylate cyclase n=1 Tax=Vibrio maerlii TaxID=2231648 RepID=UPI000E3EB69E|nr:diguanylate cyclase [Vibrio maerlii]
MPKTEHDSSTFQQVTKPGFISIDYVIKAMVCLLTASAIVLVATIHYFFEILDNRAAKEVGERVSLAFNIEKKYKKSQLIEYSYWDETYNNVFSEKDEQWIEWNSGQYVLDNFDYDFSLALRHGYEVISLTTSEQAQNLKAQMLLDSDLVTMVSLSRAREDVTKVVSSFMLLGNDLYFVVGAPLINEELETPRLGTYLAFGKKISPAYLESLSNEYQIKGLTYNTSIIAGQHHLKIRSLKGEILGGLSWKIKNSSQELLPAVGLIITSFFLSIIVASWSLLTREQRDKEAYLNKLYMEATRDALTDAFNRKYFLDIASLELRNSRIQNRFYTLAILDIDHFKQVNDKYGHIIGDQALVFFSNLCQSELRKTDIFGRVGGEEFAIAFTNTSEDEAQQILERIRTKVMTSSLQLENDTLQFTVSSGVATLTKQTSLRELLRQADNALYEAKDSGRNKVCCYQFDLANAVEC